MIVTSESKGLIHFYYSFKYALNYRQFLLQTKSLYLSVIYHWEQNALFKFYRILDPSSKHF